MEQGSDGYHLGFGCLHWSLHVLSGQDGKEADDRELHPQCLGLFTSHLLKKWVSAPGQTGCIELLRGILLLCYLGWLSQPSAWVSHGHLKLTMFKAKLLVVPPNLLLQQFFPSQLMASSLLLRAQPSKSFLTPLFLSYSTSTAIAHHVVSTFMICAIIFSMDICNSLLPHCPVV